MTCQVFPGEFLSRHDCGTSRHIKGSPSWPIVRRIEFLFEKGSRTSGIGSGMSDLVHVRLVHDAEELPSVDGATRLTGTDLQSIKDDCVHKPQHR